MATFYSPPAGADCVGTNFDAEGFISADWLKANTPIMEADFDLCGPRAFLRTLVLGLAEAGVPSDCVRFKFFSPQDEDIAA